MQVHWFECVRFIKTLMPYQTNVLALLNWTNWPNLDKYSQSLDKITPRLYTGDEKFMWALEGILMKFLAVFWASLQSWSNLGAKKSEKSHLDLSSHKLCLKLENRVNMITFHWPDPKANTEQVALSAECFAMIKLWYPVKLMGPGWPRGEISVQPLRMISDMWARDFVMEILHWYQMDISVFNKYIGSKFHEAGILLNQPLTIPLLVHWDTIHQI